MLHVPVTADGCLSVESCRTGDFSIDAPIWTVSAEGSVCGSFGTSVHIPIPVSINQVGRQLNGATCFLMLDKKHSECYSDCQLRLLCAGHLGRYFARRLHKNVASILIIASCACLSLLIRPLNECLLTLYTVLSTFSVGLPSLDSAYGI